MAELHGMWWWYGRSWRTSDTQICWRRVHFNPPPPPLPAPLDMTICQAQVALSRIYGTLYMSLSRKPPKLIATGYHLQSYKRNNGHNNVNAGQCDTHSDSLQRGQSIKGVSLYFNNIAFLGRLYKFLRFFWEADEEMNDESIVTIRKYIIIIYMNIFKWNFVMHLRRCSQLHRMQMTIV